MNSLRRRGKTEVVVVDIWCREESRAEQKRRGCGVVWCGVVCCQYLMRELETHGSSPAQSMHRTRQCTAVERVEARPDGAPLPSLP